MIEAAYIYDDAHLFTSLARARRQTRGRWALNFVKVICTLLFVAMAALLFHGKQIVGGLVLLAPIPFLAFAHWLDRPTIRRRFKKSPFYNASVRFRLSEAQVEVNDGKVDARIDWSVFDRLVLFDDGILVFQGEGVFNWFPASAFATSADYEAAVALFRAKIPRQRDLRRLPR